jgi:two-component system nitrate/nitrite response regulator NarL
MKTVRLMVVDDHNLFRRGLVALLSQDQRLEVVQQAADLGEALRNTGAIEPDVILLDNHLPGVRGIDGIPALREAYRSVRIVMLTVSEDEEDLAAAMQAGADGYLLKTVESDQLCDSILKVMAGESVISPEMMTKFVTVFRSRVARPAENHSLASSEVENPSLVLPTLESDELQTLSAREREILSCLAKGDSNKVIARALDIAEATVKVHVQNILRKLQLSSRVQAAVYAASRGMT